MYLKGQIIIKTKYINYSMYLKSQILLMIVTGGSIYDPWGNTGRGSSNKSCFKDNI